MLGVLHVYSDREDVFPEEEPPRIRRLWSKLSEGDDSNLSITPNIRKDGKNVDCEWFSTPLRDASGNVSGILSMVHDITEKTQLERQLQTAQRMEAVGGGRAPAGAGGPG